MSTTPRRSSRGRRVAKRFIEDEYELMPLAGVPKSDAAVPPKQHVSMNAIKNDADSTNASTETPASNNSKKRRKSNQNGVTSSFTSPSRRKKRIKVTVSPSFLVPQEFTDTPLTATVNRPKQKTGRSRMRGGAPPPLLSKTSIDLMFTSPTLVDTPPADSEVRIFLTPCPAVSQPLADVPLYAILPKDETTENSPFEHENNVPAASMSKENMEKSPDESKMAESKNEECSTASKVTPTPDYNKKRKSNDDSHVSTVAPRDMWPKKVPSDPHKTMQDDTLLLQDMLPPCPDTPLARQNSLQASNTLVPSLKAKKRKGPDEAQSLPSEGKTKLSITLTSLTRQTTPSEIDTKLPTATKPLTRQTTPSGVDAKLPAAMTAPLARQAAPSNAETPVSRTAATPVMSNVSSMNKTTAKKTPSVQPPSAKEPKSSLFYSFQKTSTFQGSRGGALFPGISRTLSRCGSMSGLVEERKKLKRIVCKFYSYVLTRGDDEVDLNVASKTLKVPKRRIYDIVNGLEGIGILERVEGDKNNKWRLTSALAPRSDIKTQMLREAVDEVKKLEQEDRALDLCLAKAAALAKHNGNLERDQKYITSQQLAPFLHQDALVLAVSTPSETVLKRPHSIDGKPIGHHVFNLVPPKNAEGQVTETPQVNLVESADKLYPLPLMPFPSLLESCCSDFSYDALRAQGLERQRSEGSGIEQILAAGGVMDTLTSKDDLGLERQRSEGSSGIEQILAASGEMPLATRSKESMIAAEALTNLAIGDPLLMRQESVSTLDETETPPPVSSLSKAENSPTLTAEKTVQDENKEAFQYPWLKDKPGVGNTKYAPKRATRGLLGDSDSEDEETPPHKPSMPSAGTIGSLRPDAARPTLMWEYRTRQDTPPTPPHPSATIIKKISADLAPLPNTVLHECTSLVLCND